jgi:hypothetical protein
MGTWITDPRFLTSTLVGGEWSASFPGRFTPGERTPCTHWIGGWMEPRTSLNDVKKRKFLTLQEFEFRPLDRQACNQSLYRLRYPGSSLFHSNSNYLVKCQLIQRRNLTVLNLAIVLQITLPTIHCYTLWLLTDTSKSLFHLTCAQKLRVRKR